MRCKAWHSRRAARSFASSVRRMFRTTLAQKTYEAATELRLHPRRLRSNARNACSRLFSRRTTRSQQAKENPTCRRPIRATVRSSSRTAVRSWPSRDWVTARRHQTKQPIIDSRSHRRRTRSTPHAQEPCYWDRRRGHNHRDNTHRNTHCNRLHNHSPTWDRHHTPLGCPHRRRHRTRSTPPAQGRH